MKKIMRDYYLDLDRASKAPDEYVAWCTSAGPAELLRSMGFKVYFPENHSAILGSSRTAGEFIPIGNSAGYSPDICTYLTADIGAFLQETTPLTKMYGISTVPKPDVLVYSTNQCRDTQEWFRFYSEYLKVPFIGVNPPHNLPKVSPYDLENVSAQFQNMIPTLEKITGHDFEVSRLKKTLQNSLEATQLWKKVLNLGQHIPSPLTFFDSCIHMGPIVVLRGEEIAIEYYRKLYDELRLRVKEGFGAVEDEKVRIYWEGMPIWGRLRQLSTIFAENNASVVVSTYCNSWVFDNFNANDPFGSMARVYTEIFINRAEDYKQEYLLQMAKEFEVDGFVYHDCKTCPNNSNNRYRLPNRVQEKIGLPFIVVNGDMNDLRCYSEEQTKTAIEAFIEQLTVNKEMVQLQ